MLDAFGERKFEGSKFDQAELAIRKVIELQPANAEAYAVLAQTQLPAHRDPQGAVVSARKAVELSPTASNHFVLGTVFIFHRGSDWSKRSRSNKRSSSSQTMPSFAPLWRDSNGCPIACTTYACTTCDSADLAVVLLSLSCNSTRRDQRPTEATTSLQNETSSTSVTPSQSKETNALSSANKLNLKDITATSGIDFVHQYDGHDQRYIIEAVGSGMATLDFDADGASDVFFFEWLSHTCRKRS